MGRRKQLIKKKGKDDAIRSAYYSLESPSSFSGLQKVYKEAKKLFPETTKKDVENFLAGERTYTLYKPARHRFPRLRTIPSGLHTDWQCDLAMFDQLKKFNDGYAYLLVCVDVLSRKIFIAPVKSKRSSDMIVAFDKIFEKSGGILPHKLYSDKGLEFQAKPMLEYFENKGIIKHVMYTPHIHAGVVERANRTIKERLYRYFSENNTQRWVDVIDKVVDGINNNVCRATGETPNAITFENAETLFTKVYKGSTNSQDDSKPKFSEGDIVRISKEKGAFGRGYHPNYTDELFRIRTVKPTQPPHYKLEDLDGEQILGVFYEQELVRTRIDTTFRIAEIIKTRKSADGEKEHLVRWTGYSDKFNSWIRESDIIG